MDINYILGREQTSLHNAQVANSSSARASHRGLAAAYGRLLAESGFPHRSPVHLRFRRVDEDSAERWDDDGGTVSGEGIAVPPGLDTAQDIHTRPDNLPAPGVADDVGNSLIASIRTVERNERLLALQYSAGSVSVRSFQSRSRFRRQDRASLAMMSLGKLPENAS